MHQTSIGVPLTRLWPPGPCGVRQAIAAVADKFFSRGAIYRWG